MAGQIVSKTDPVYPEIARAAGVSGAVVLHAIIGTDGTVQNLQVISGPEMLRASAIDAVRHWVYKPYLLNGEPTEVDTTITVNYNLAEAAPPPPAAVAAPDPVAPANVPVKVSGRVMDAMAIRKVPPTYPASARAQGLAGAVVMRAVIDQGGRVQQLQVMSGPDLLRQAAIEAVRQWIYKPYLLNGAPASVETTVTITFRG